MRRQIFSRTVTLGALLAGGWSAASPAHELGRSGGEATGLSPPMKLYLEDAKRQQVNFGGNGGRMRGLLYTLKLWPAQARIEVCFKDGPDDLRTVFVETSMRWAQGTSLRLDFGTGAGYRACDPARPSDIRVSFSQNTGHWSFVGIDSRGYNRAGPSLNIAAKGSLATLERSELERLTLHEMGHAIGLEHEHQSPESPCGTEFDWPKLYDVARREWAWTKEVVDHNMKTLVAKDRLVTTPYDPQSVMHYQFSEKVFTRGRDSPCYVGVNATMSSGDRDTIQNAYPPAVASLDPLQRRATDASRVLASMSLTGPDLLRFGGELAGQLRTAERTASLSFSLVSSGTRGGTRAAAPGPTDDCAPRDAIGAAAARPAEVLCRAAVDGSSLIVDVTPK